MNVAEVKMKMKKIKLFILLSLPFSISAQIDADALMGMPTANNIGEITAITPDIGATVYNLADDEIYRFTSTGWQIATDDQTASEVILDTATDIDGDAANETTVEDVIQDIAPITSIAARIFYPPSILVDASSTGAKPDIDLYDEYLTQFGAPEVASTNAPLTIPTYGPRDLYYYVTFADKNVFGDPPNISINEDGVMSYSISNTPTDFNTLINVIFVVR